jgi:hypothetical protein
MCLKKLGVSNNLYKTWDKPAAHQLGLLLRLHQGFLEVPRFPYFFDLLH